MAAPAYLSIVEYLNTTYEPDLEYVDGQLVERKVGKWEQARHTRRSGLSRPQRIFVPVLPGQRFVFLTSYWSALTST
jgi:hypothetical protein